MYDKPAPYKSPLRVGFNFPSFVTYKCPTTDVLVGKVYKNAEGKWYLTSSYLRWQPIEVFTKIGGFLFLNQLHKRRHHTQ